MTGVVAIVERKVLIQKIMDDETEIDRGFVRQRRNLILVSLALLFAEVTGLHIDTLSIFGNEFSLERPTSVTPLLWVAGFYWLWRFYQYFNASKTGHWENAVSERIKLTVPDTAFRLALSEHKDALAPFEEWPQVRPEYELAGREWGSYSKSEISLILAIRKTASEEERAISTTVTGLRVTVAGRHLFWLRLRAWLHVIISTPVFTDNFLPVLLFLCPIVVMVWKFFAP